MRPADRGEHDDTEIGQYPDPHRKECRACRRGCLRGRAGMCRAGPRFYEGPAQGLRTRRREAPCRRDAVRRNIRLEPARSEDAEAMLTVHRAAIRGEAARFYSA